MAYLHCHNCNWSQDDFWDEKYNPITFLENNWTQNLLSKDLDELTEVQKYTRKGEAYLQQITWRELIAQELETQAMIIRCMVYRTNEEFKQDRKHKCPNCGKNMFDID